MKIIQMIKELGGNRAAIAKSAGITEQQLNNYVSQDREVVKLANGNYMTTSKHSKIFKVEIGVSDESTKRN